MKPVEEHEFAEEVRSLLNEAHDKAGLDEGNEFELGKEKITLLLVDDEIAIFESLKRALKLANIDLIYASSGEKAVEIYQSRGAAIDIVLTDLAMPGMRGDKAAEKILEINPQAKILMMSGYGDWERITESLKGPLAGLLDKPFNSKELLQVIGKVMAQKPETTDPKADPD